MRSGRVGLVCLAVCALLGVGGDAPRERMREIYALSGLEAHLAGFSEHVARGVRESGRDVAPEVVGVLRSVIREAFAKAALERHALALLESRYDARHAGPTLAWLRSPLGRRITALEEAAAAPDSLEALQAYREKLAKRPAAPGRLALAERLDAVFAVSEFALDGAIAASLAVALTLDATVPTLQRTDPDELRARVEAERSRLRPSLVEMTKISLLYTYRDLSDAELERYATFGESESGRWYNRVLQKALLETYVSAAMGVGEALAEELERTESERTT